MITIDNIDNFDVSHI